MVELKSILAWTGGRLTGSTQNITNTLLEQILELGLNLAIIRKQARVDLIIFIEMLSYLKSSLNTFYETI